MNKEIFNTILDLSQRVTDTSWEIEKLMKILLQDTDADLNKLHEDLYFFAKLYKYCGKDAEYHNRHLRTCYLRDVYGKYFETEQG